MNLLSVGVVRETGKGRMVVGGLAKRPIAECG
jgi:hypothetical protein